MDLAQQKEKFSDAYLQAIAAVAEYGLAKPNPDSDSVDWIISAQGVGETIRRPRLEVQMKCTARDIVQPTHLHFPLEVKNYNDLRHPDPLTPCILIVVTVPDILDEWIAHSEAELSMRRCGYWISLCGEPETSNTSTITIPIPRIQTFTPQALKRMMQRINFEGRL